MPAAKKVQTPFATPKRENVTDWQLKCPACDRTLSFQPITVSELRDPFFKCRFCDVAGTAIWDNSGRNRLVRA
jgi:hypothetical protein